MLARQQPDQAGESTFPKFVEATFNAGTVRYIVDTTARTVTYFGTRGEKYIEEYPPVTVPSPAETTPE